ncbi:MAG TPA: NAD(+) diphosphatase [Burkholderiales bacterium]|nr:NAD(+) diphosphatase [Burkholderiales bacterium]
MAEVFVPLIAPPQSVSAPGLWFVFQGSQVLVRREEAHAYLPVALHVREIGLEPLRHQYLGLYAGQHCFSCEVAADVAAPAGMTWAGLRSLFGALDDALFALVGRAIQVMDWDRSHQYCGRCGTPTVVKGAERARQCPSCGQVHYPRIAPAVMALVRNGDALLLARSPHFPPGMHSALAGFVEPGESLEQCLHREVREEVGLEVTNLRYFSSQPWPFPHSLMIAFNCDYAGGEITPEAGEIEAAAWFGIDDLPVLPNRISIARRLIDAAIAQIRSGRPVTIQPG